MWRLTGGILDEIREDQKSVLGLVNQVALISQNKGNDFWIDENGIMRIRDSVCIPDVSGFEEIILVVRYE